MVEPSQDEDIGVVLIIPATKRQPETRIKVSKQDVDAVCELSLWIDDKGYVRCSARCGYRYLHNFIMQYSDPLYPIDHINENPLDNRRTNLRKLARNVNTQRPVRLDEEEARLLEDYQEGKLVGSIHDHIRERRNRKRI